MKRSLLSFSCALFLILGTALSLTAQAAKPGPAKPVASSDALEKVLGQMDSAADAFKSVEADLVWELYTKVIDSMDEPQKGKIYFRRQSKETEMAIDFAEPAKKYVLFTGGDVQVYEPKINTVTKYNTGKNRADVEAFLVLGFGGRGHDLAKSFDVRYAGNENIGGITTSKLELSPKSVRLRNNLNRIILWIAPNGLSLQQQFFEPSGNYKLAKYNNIKLNQKLSDGVFKLKTSGKTKVVSAEQ